MGKNSNSPLLAGVIVALAAVLSYSPLLFGGGWFSDDYMQVYGLHGQPLPDFEESVREAGAGSVSVVRTFSHGLMGYGGFFLGEFAAMAVRVAGHALNAWLLFLLLRRIAVTRQVALAAALIFATTPWHTQAVVWWATVHLGFAITFILLALLVYQSWLERGAAWRLVFSQALVFVSLMTYEQALAGWLVFFGVALLQPAQLEDLKSARWIRTLRYGVAASWPMLVPFALWTVLYLVSYPLESNIRTPKTAIDRNLVALASTHFRWFDSVFHLSWADLLRQGVASMTPFAAIFTGLFAVGAAWLLGWRGRRVNAPQASGAALIITLAFSYLLFVGFRLVFVMQGATSTETRNNYGADMGVALAIAALAYFLFAGKLRRPVLYALVVSTLCLLNIFVTRGEAWHVACNVEDEDKVFAQAVRVLTNDREVSVLDVIVKKQLTKGEKKFYEEKDGDWLKYRLFKTLSRDIKVHIYRDGSEPVKSGAIVELN